MGLNRVPVIISSAWGLGWVDLVMLAPEPQSPERPNQKTTFFVVRLIPT